MNALLNQMPLGIYIHVPFCVRKCFYCDFLSAPSNEQTREDYVTALCGEIRAQASLYRNYCVKTVFFGGGTPSLLTGVQIGRIMKELRDNFQFADEFGEKMEITMEANPGTLSAENLHAYRQAGINRLSIGLQSADEEELRRLGRIHTWQEFLDNFAAAREAGFDNVNVDLMSALPGQSVESWMGTVQKVVELDPEHISAYSLIVEEGTPFFEWYGEESDALPTEDDDRRMYAWTKEYLAEKGYARYEFSNYAKPGFECRHNSSYWKRIDYAGLGLGSSSLRQNVRWNNTSDLKKYLDRSCETGEGIKENRTVLTVAEQMEEFMFLGLRMSEGVSEQKFQEAFGKSIRDQYGTVMDRLIQEGLLLEDRENARVFLTDYGVDVSNYVLAEFLLDQE